MQACTHTHYTDTHHKQNDNYLLGIHYKQTLGQFDVPLYSRAVKNIYDSIITTGPAKSHCTGYQLSEICA